MGITFASFYFNVTAITIDIITSLLLFTACLMQRLLVKVTFANLIQLCV